MGFTGKGAESGLKTDLEEGVWFSLDSFVFHVGFYSCGVSSLELRGKRWGFGSKPPKIGVYGTYPSLRPSSASISVLGGSMTGKWHQFPFFPLIFVREM